MIQAEVNFKTKYGKYRSKLMDFNDEMHMSNWESLMMKKGHNIIGIEILPKSIDVQNTLQINEKLLHRIAAMHHYALSESIINAKLHSKDSQIWYEYTYANDIYRILVRKNKMTFYKQKELMHIPQFRSIIEYMKTHMSK